MIVRACASSANLGPGFDCFGLAWQCRDTIEFLPEGEGLVIEGCHERYRNESNLAYRAYKAALDEAGAEDGPLVIRFLETQIPVSRGLGSSAALIVAGVQAANELRELGFSRQELLRIATGVEGHPDNVAPALCGGLTVSAMDGDQVVTVPARLSDKLRFAALVPDFELSTELSRSVLPESFSRADAIFNMSRAALLLRALELGDGELLKTALQDRLHQPYRKRLIEGYDRAEALALGCGAEGVCISGAGSTMLCVSTGDFIGRLERAMAEEFPSWQVMEMIPERSVL